MFASLSVRLCQGGCPRDPRARWRKFAEQVAALPACDGVLLPDRVQAVVVVNVSGDHLHPPDADYVTDRVALSPPGARRRWAREVEVDQGREGRNVRSVGPHVWLTLEWEELCYSPHNAFKGERCHQSTFCWWIHQTRGLFCRFFPTFFRKSGTNGNAVQKKFPSLLKSAPGLQFGQHFPHGSTKLFLGFGKRKYYMDCKNRRKGIDEPPGKKGNSAFFWAGLVHDSLPIRGFKGGIHSIIQ